MALTILPNAGQNLNNTRDAIRNNFSLIENAFIVNHVDYGNSNPLAGKHNLVTMPVQAADPGTLSGEMALYTKAVSGTAQLFLQTDNSAAVINLTSSGQATNGWTRLPSGILLKWGTVSGIAIQGLGATPQTANFPTSGTIPVFTGIFSVQVTCGVSTNLDYNQTIILTAFNNTTFTVVPRQLSGFPSGNTQTVYFFAIGI